MKLSKVMHAIAILVSILGVLVLFGAWIAGQNGTFIGFSQEHLFYDAIVFQLIAIAFAACTLIRMQLEKDSPGSLF